MGYFGIALLMFLENVFPPLPSEVIMPMAGFTASQGKLALPGILIAGTLGTTAGAIFWYIIARWTGAERLKRWTGRHGRWITLSAEHIAALEERFRKSSGWAVPIGHLVPGIRTLISIPAGVFRMRPVRFLLLTLLGAGTWTSLLGVAGFLLGDKFDQVDRYMGPAGTLIMIFIAIAYFYRVATFNKTRQP